MARGRAGPREAPEAAAGPAAAAAGRGGGGAVGLAARGAGGLEDAARRGEVPHHGFLLALVWSYNTYYDKKPNKKKGNGRTDALAGYYKNVGPRAFSKQDTTRQRQRPSSTGKRNRRLLRASDKTLHSDNRRICSLPSETKTRPYRFLFPRKIYTMGKKTGPTTITTTDGGRGTRGAPSACAHTHTLLVYTHRHTAHRGPPCLHRSGRAGLVQERDESTPARLCSQCAMPGAAAAAAPVSLPRLFCLTSSAACSPQLPFESWRPANHHLAPGCCLLPKTLCVHESRSRRGIEISPSVDWSMIGTAQQTWFGGWWRRAAPIQIRCRRTATSGDGDRHHARSPSKSGSRPLAGAALIHTHMAGSLVECAECVGLWLRKQLRKGSSSSRVELAKGGGKRGGGRGGRTCLRCELVREAVAVVGAQQPSTARRFVRRRRLMAGAGYWTPPKRD